MHIPLNAIHWYVGIPFALFIGFRGLLQYKKDKNKLNQYLGLIGIFYTLCFLTYGIPALFFENSTVLTLSTILGDILQFVALFVVWLAVIRAYAAKRPFLKGIMLTLVVILLGLSVYLSISTNLSNPVTISQSVDGGWVLNFYFSGIYAVVTAMQYTSFLLLAFFFASQAKFTNDYYKKIRVYTIATILFIIGAVYVLQPAIISTLDFRSTTLILALNIAIAGLFIAGTLVMSNKKK